MGHYKILYEAPQFIFVDGYRWLLVDDGDFDYYQLYYCRIGDIRWHDFEVYYPKNVRGLVAACKTIGLLKWKK